MKKVRWNRHYGYYQVFPNVLGLLNIHPNHDITHTTNGMPGPFAKMSWYQAEADPHSLHEWWFMEREGETTGDQKETPSVIEIAYINTAGDLDEALVEAWKASFQLHKYNRALLSGTHTNY